METQEVDDVISSHVTYSKRVLKLKGGETALLANGRVSVERKKGRGREGKYLKECRKREHSKRDERKRDEGGGRREGERNREWEIERGRE